MVAIVGALAAVCVVLVLIVVGILGAIFGALKSSEPYHHGIEVATHDARVVRALGAPIQPGWLPSGNINMNGPSGEANLEISLKGSSRTGTIFVIAHRSRGAWSYQIFLFG